MIRGNLDTAAAGWDRLGRPVRLLVFLSSALALFGLLQAGKAHAVTPAPLLEGQLIALPTNLEVGPYFDEVAGEGTFQEISLVTSNVGTGALSGTVTATIRLSPGVTYRESRSSFTIWSCPTVVGLSEFTCEENITNSEGVSVPLQFSIDVGPTAVPAATIEAEVSGGGAVGPTTTSSITVPVGGPPLPFSITRWSIQPSGAAGEPYDRAAGHPGVLSSVFTQPIKNYFEAGVSESEIGPFRSLPVRSGIENIRDLVVDLPLGLVGNPTAVARCPIQTFLTHAASPAGCPAGSQVGSFVVSGNSGPGGTGPIPVYNLIPEPGFPAEFGFYDSELSHGVLAQASLAHTAAGYVVRFEVPELPKGGIAGPYFLQASFFGEPARGTGVGLGAPFLTMPSSCDGRPLVTTLHVDTWTNPAAVPRTPSGAPDFAGANFADPQWHDAVSESPAVAGCESLTFAPTVKFVPDGPATDSPTGLGVNVEVPQNEAPEGRATPPLRTAVVTLPRGLVVNPSVAAGLAGCTPAQLSPNSTEPGGCPAGSKIGSATLRTPLVDHPLLGSVYVGTPECAPCGDADAAAGKLLKLYIEIDDPATGVVVKLTGSVSANPTTGQLTATFNENPQLPFEDLELHLKSGSRAPLTTPSTCGDYTTTTDLKPWSAPQSGPDARPQARFGISTGPEGRPCPTGESGLANNPAFEAGTVTPLAGTYSPFVLRVNRENGSQRISALQATLPEGLLGKLAGIPYCPETAIATAASKSGAAEQADPSCPPSSQIGTVDVGAGSGTPFHVQGRAYLAGPYKGAPLSLEIVTPAVAGPFDLGTVVVRTALNVDPITTQIHAVSDPIPSILAGVPLDIRSIALDLDRAGFVLNPTSCDPKQIVGDTTSTLGQVAPLRSRFQVGGCGGLAFKPKLALRLSGSTQRGKNPALRAVLTQAAGQTNIRKVSVVLPKSEFIDNRHVNNPCTRVQFAAGAGNGAECPAKSILGHARAFSPLLDKPLEGPVYFRSNGGERRLPDLVASLDGQVHVNLIGFIDSVRKKGSETSRTRNTFAMVPDAPVSKFVLSLDGGNKGLLQNSANLCKVKNVAQIKFTGQNNKVDDFAKAIANDCAKGNKKNVGGR